MDIPTIVQTAQSAASGDMLTALQTCLPDSVFAGITAAVAVCAATAIWLPAPKPTSGRAYRGLYAVVNWVACNLGRAKNAQDSKPVQANWRLR